MLQQQWPEENGEGDEGPSLIGFRVDRKWDGDFQVLDLRTGDTKSEGGHYMLRTKDRVKYLNHRNITPPGEHMANEILHEHWIAPHRC